MNEWSPKGFNSGSVTTGHQPQTRFYRHCWEENFDQGKTNATSKVMNGSRIRDYQKPGDCHQFVSDDVTNPLCYSTKKKKNGISDPRFKRVINNAEDRNDLSVDMNGLKMSQALKDGMGENGILAKNFNPYFTNTPNNAVLSELSNYRKFGDQNEICQQNFSEVAAKHVGFSPFLKHQGSTYMYQSGNFQNFSNLDNMKDNENIKINSKTNLRRSASDCTLHTKTPLMDENDEEFSHRIRLYPSATRLSKVQNWIKEYKILPEKRRSVITVIGQTQTKPFSKILNEINQRRKLAKELDKHALCEAIMESAENQSDIKNLVAKVNFVLPDGKIVYSAEKSYFCKENGRCKIDINCGEQKSAEKDFSEGRDQVRKRYGMIPERDSSVSQLGKRSRSKRSSQKLETQVRDKFHIIDKIKTIYARISFKFLWSFLLLVCLLLCFCACYYIIKPFNPLILPEFFKPKTTTWYEKLLL